MPNYVVVAVKGSEQWNGQHGPMLSYTLTVAIEGRELDCQINKKPSSPTPQPGDVIDGTLTPSDNPAFLPKLKANFSQGGGGKGRDPKDTAAMSRSAAQDRALAYMQVKATMGVLKVDFKPEALVPLIEWFQNDVKRHQAEGEAKTVGGLPVRNEPERTGGPEAVTPSADFGDPGPEGDVPWAGAA